MISIDSDKEFILVRKSFSVFKKINLKEIGFNQILSSNLYIYQSNEYKILNYSIKPQLIFSINIEDELIDIKLVSMNIKNLPNIFKTLQLTVEANIFPEKDFCKVNRHISIGFESKNKFIRYISQNYLERILQNLIEKISMRFDKKLIKKVLKAI